MDKRINRFIKILTGILITFFCCLIIGIISGCKTRKLAKVELIEGTYDTEYKLGRAPTLCGAQLRLTYSDSTQETITVTEEMMGDYNADLSYCYALESDVQTDDEGNNYVVTSQNLIAKYQNFIVSAQVDIELAEYITINYDGVILGSNGLSQLEVLIIPDKVEFGEDEIVLSRIGDEAFKGAPLSAIVLPSTIIGIQSRAFENCLELRQVIFVVNKSVGKSLEYIGEEAFKNCSELEIIELPKSISILSRDAFKGCSKLKEINIEQGSKNFVSVSNEYSGVVYDRKNFTVADYNSAYIWPEGKKYTTIYLHKYGEIEERKGPAGAKLNVFDPVMENHDFTGWYEEEQCENLVESPIFLEEDLHLYAGWKISDSAMFKITYLLEGATEENNKENPSHYKYSETDLPLNDPTRDGYDFLGWKEWNSETNSWEDNDVIKKYSEGEKTFKATWKPRVNTISYIFDKGTPVDTLTDGYTIEDEVILVDLIEDGYDFEGWLDEEGLPVTKIERGGIRNRQFTAKWNPIQYSITYKNISEEDISKYNLTKNYTIESNTFNIPQPEKKGYSFTCWNDGEEVSNPYTVKKGSHRDISLTAVWTPKTYYLTYELNGGEADNFTEYTIESDDIVINPPVKSGYHFTGWKIDNAETPCLEYTVIKGSTEDINFEAVWKENIYTVVFDVQGATENVEPISVNYGVPKILPVISITRKGYEFGGWQCDLNGEIYNSGDDISLFVTEDKATITFVAIWTPIDYTVIYYDGATKVSESQYVYASRFAFKEEDYKAGHKDLKWGVVEKESPVKVTAGTKVAVGDVEQFDQLIDYAVSDNENRQVINLYAQWTARTYTFVDNISGAELGTAQYGGIYNWEPRIGYAFGGLQFEDCDKPVKIVIGEQEGQQVAFGHGNEIKVMHILDAYPENRVPVKEIYKAIQYKIKVNDKKTVEFDIEHAKSKEEIQTAGFGHIFKNYKVEKVDQDDKRELYNGNRKIDSLTAISKGTYVTNANYVLKNGNYIAEIEEKFFNLEQYGEEGRNFSNYVNDNGVLIIDLRNESNLRLSRKFNVNSDVKLFAIFGTADKIYTDFTVNIVARTTPLKICLQNFSFVAAEENYGLFADSNFDLTISYTGINKIQGGTGKQGTIGENGKDGAPAEQQTEKDGANGTNAAYKSQSAVHGKDGKDGNKGNDGADGAKGGVGNVGKTAVKTVRKPSFEKVSGTLTVQGGTGGTGGTGGKGGNGSNGEDGGKGGNGGKSYHWYLFAAFTLYGDGGDGGKGGAGGNAGAGGRGGDGGRGGYAIECLDANKIDEKQVTLVKGHGGAAGADGLNGTVGSGGIGGKGGANGNGQWYGGLGGNLITVIVEACRNGGGNPGLDRSGEKRVNGKVNDKTGSKTAGAFGEKFP